MSTVAHARVAAVDDSPAAVVSVPVSPRCPAIELPPGFALEWTAALRTAPIRPHTGECPSLGSTPAEVWTAFLEHDPGPGHHVSGFSPHLGRFIVRDGDVFHAGGERRPINSEMRSAIGREIAGGTFLVYAAPNDAAASAREARVLHDVADHAGPTSAGASIDCSGLPPDASRVAGGELARSTTSAGIAGADCQPVWGTSLGIHLVGVSDRDGSRGRFITPAEAPEFCGERRHGGVGLWVAEVTSTWRQDEDGSSEHLQRLRVLPLHQFVDESRPGSYTVALGEAHQSMRAFARRSMDDDQITDQTYVDTENRIFAPARAAQICEEAMHRLGAIAGSAQMSLDELVAISRSDPLAVGPRVNIASPIHDVGDQERQLAIIHARAKVRHLGRELAGDKRNEHPVMKARIASILADLAVPTPQRGG